MKQLINLAFSFFILIFFVLPDLNSQAVDFTATQAEVDFSVHLRDWDGFGFNYVETAQTMDYATDPQDYGGFSLYYETPAVSVTTFFGQ